MSPINCESWLVSLDPISSCFFASLSVIGSAVGPVTNSGINFTSDAPLNQNQRHTILQAFQPITDWKALPHLKQIDYH